MRPARRVGKAHAFFNQEFQPKRRKSEPVKFGAFYDFPVFFDDPRAGDQLHLPFQDPVHYQLRRGAFGPYPGGDDYVCVQDAETTLAFRGLGTLRACLIFCSTSSSSTRSKPADLAWSQLSRRLAFAIALRNSRSSIATSPSTGTRKYAGPCCPDSKMVSPCGTASRAFEPRVRNSRREI